MIAEAGLAALWMAAALAALQMLIGYLGVNDRFADLRPAIRPITVVQAVLAVISMLSEIGARRAARLYGQLVRDGKPADVDVFVITKESYHASVSIGVSRTDGRKRPRGPVDEPRPDQHEHQHEHQHPDVQP